jgi:hypothetical protein
VLKESEAKAVRKAVCVAGGEHVVVTPIPYWMCGVDIVDIESERRVRESVKHVRLDVTAEESRSGSIVSAIRNISQAGSIALATLYGKLPKRAA